MKCSDCGNINRETAKFCDECGMCLSSGSSYEDRFNEKVREIENSFYNFLDASFEGIVIHDGREIFAANRTISHMTGYGMDELIGLNPFKLIAPECHKDAIKNLAEKSEKPIEYTGLRKDGSREVIELYSKYITYKGKPARVLAIRDITERKIAEKKIEEQKNFYKIILDSIVNGVIVTDKNDIITYMNKGMGIISDINHEDAPGKHIFEDFPGAGETAKFYFKAKEILTPVYCNGVYIKNPSGKNVCQSGWAIPMTENGQFNGMICTIDDITERMEAEKIVKRRQKELSVRNDIARIFLTTEADGVYEKILPVILKSLDSQCGVMGYINETGDFVNVSITENGLKNSVWPKNTWSKFWNDILFEGKVAYDNIIVSPDIIFTNRAMGMPVIYNNKVIGAISIANKEKDYNDDDRSFFETISSFVSPILFFRLERNKFEKERNSLENQLRQSQKMEAIGTLAGGIAHDFNNILGIIIGNMEIALENTDENQNIYPGLARVLKASERAKSMINQILTFSRKQEQERKLVNVNLLIEETIVLIRSSIPSYIELKKEIRDKTSVIMADPTQIQQILINLCTNAYYAMKKHGGTITIGLDKCEIRKSNMGHSETLKPGSYVKITVSDTGMGMDGSTLERIFEPYFTTKPHGEGTGMGLAVVHGIVKSYRGDIKVFSEKYKGTIFKIYLPRIRTQVDIKPDVVSEPVSGSGKILYVDDEEDLLYVIKLTLVNLGYDVIVKSDSSEALEEFSKNPGNFDLVITDHSMPGMTGDKLAEELMKIRPDIPIILCTGFSDMMDKNNLRKIGIRDIILKPLSKKNLSEAVNRIMKGEE